MKMKNWSDRYDINRPCLARHGHKYTKFKKCLSTMMVKCIKQHLSNIWSSVHEKVKSNTEAKFKTIVTYKKACISLDSCKLTHSRENLSVFCF